MHELAIAQNIVDIIKRNVSENELSNVDSIKLKIGEMAGVVTDSLEFGFQAITSGTELELAKLTIEKIPFVFKCNACGKESTNEYGITVCPECNGTDTNIISGLEMQIVEVELRDEAQPTLPKREVKKELIDK
jgi:hydrogenase nickel incorporation protein HypA/HybF